MLIVRRMWSKSANLLKEADELGKMKGCGKAFLSGVIDGFVDGAFAIGTVCIIKMIYLNIKK